MKLKFLAVVLTCFWAVLYPVRADESIEVIVSNAMDEKAFTQKMYLAFIKEFPKMTFKVIKPLKLHGKGEKDLSIDIFLDNAFQLYRAGQYNLAQVIKGQMNGIKAQKNASQAVAVKNILPVIKPKSYIDGVKAQFAKMKAPLKGLPLVFEKLNDELYLLYVFDTPKTMSFVSPDNLKKLKLGKQDIKAIARKNLATYYKKVRASFRKITGQDKGNIYYLGAKENFEASALVMMDKPLWNGQKLSLKGAPVIFISARNVFMVTGSEDKKGLATASKMAANFYKHYGYGISPHGFILRDHKWVRFRP